MKTDFFIEEDRLNFKNILAIIILIGFVIILILSQRQNYQCCSDSDCDDNDSGTIDRCINPCTKEAVCEHEAVARCSDGTPYSQCSDDKPKYCAEGELVDKCSVCGCSFGQRCQEGGECEIVPGTCHLECEKYHYSICPEGCGKKCISSGCSDDICLDDCDGPGSCFCLPDLDVTYIERNPRYYRYCLTYGDIPLIPQLCEGTENNQRWPEAGEVVTYKAHIINKENTVSPGFAYQWLVDGIPVAAGNSSPLEAEEETVIQYQRAWSSSSENILFKVDSDNSIAETSEDNNSLAFGSHDLTISIWVEQGLYDIFNNTVNLAGSYSFEDWIQAQFAKMNERFSQAKYPVAADGITNRVRIDKIVVADDLDGSGSPWNSDADLYLIDGRWSFKDGDSTNTAGQNGKWQDYVDQFVSKIDWGLIHELAHQIGVIDLYRMNLANDPANNMRFQVEDISGNVISASQLPTYAWDQVLFEHPGIMAGGNTSPYNDGTYFESHTAAGLNTHYSCRRGYYGEYLFDTPARNYLKIVDTAGNPLVGTQVALYQKDTRTEYIDNTPEITGTTDEQGIFELPNRPVTGITTATGHTLRDNPFGQIDIVGRNGTMFVKITKDNQESYHWFFVIDTNLAYWSGNTDSATYIIETDVWE